MTKGKPQVLLRIHDEHGVHLIKKWHDSTMTIEGHTPERAANHHMNTPEYFFPVNAEFVADEFRKQGKEYRK